ncbi:ASCH domain-containing protein [Microbacterium kyungheense]|uniref:Putative transcriptional regulator n=1 Tax=Microbacterium kyungheense TaxID=1263636 RepID=A0A543F145_9MICO|nr:ASCH domain-containing protein [Microbacterium kyungheense]TQM27543.1 putative transcriptional regulator [Microbacterium kyungheense]
MSRALLLSVRPRFARALLDGTKTAEIRRRFPNVPEGMTVIIYASSPEKAVLGTMRARRLIRSNTEKIWRDYSDVIGIENSELTEYLEGASECSVLELDAPERWSRSVGLAELRHLLHVEPAQSFRYLSEKQLAHLRDVSANGPDQSLVSSAGAVLALG